jgi:TRAP-type C4-dicarboxylate transport system permease small subunit
MLNRVSRTLSGAAAGLASGVLVAITAYTLIEITLRSTVGVATNVLVEFAGYGLATMTFLGAAQTLRDGGLVRVTLVLRFMPAIVRRICDLLCLLCGILVVAWTAWFVFSDMQRSFVRGYETDSLFALPLWVPPIGMLGGMLVLLLEMIAWLVPTVRGTGKLPTTTSEAV